MGHAIFANYFHAVHFHASRGGLDEDDAVYNHEAAAGNTYVQCYYEGCRPCQSVVFQVNVNALLRERRVELELVASTSPHGWRCKIRYWL
jgi:hypothetical protein